MASSSTFDIANWKSWKLNMETECENITEDGPPRICSKIRKGMNDLKEMNIVLKQADKNLGLVAIRKDIYEHMVKTHINSQTYVEVPTFPHNLILSRMENILKARGLFWQFKIWLEYAKAATEPCPFYITPKLHKKNIGSRPITAQHSYMLSPLSKALAKVLQEEVDKIPEIAKDSKTVVSQLEKLTLMEPCVFVTFDVEQMYPSIDLKDAINTLYENLEILRRNNGFWSKILKLIMFNNYVTTNGKIYRQMTGTATGTQVAPPFANLYLHFKFGKILRAKEITYNSRYIDDGFMVVDNTNNAKNILHQLNNATNLNITFEISISKAIYLDLEIYKGKRYFTRGIPDIKVYFKPTNKLLYLPANSQHPQAHKSGIVKGEAIRCLRNCSNKEEWLKAIHIIFKGLIARGYDPKMISSKWKEVKFEDRTKYIFEETTKEPMNNTLVMTKYHPQLRYHWNRLLKKLPLERRLYISNRGKFNKKQQQILQDWPPKIIFKGFRKIGNILIRAKENTN